MIHFDDAPWAHSHSFPNQVELSYIWNFGRTTKANLAISFRSVWFLIRSVSFLGQVTIHSRGYGNKLAQKAYPQIYIIVVLYTQLRGYAERARPRETKEKLYNGMCAHHTHTHSTKYNRFYSFSLLSSLTHSMLVYSDISDKFHKRAANTFHIKFKVN